MKNRGGIQGIVVSVVIIFCLLSATSATATRVRLETTQGVILLELFDDKAPKTVANFLQYVREGFFENTIFHRVIKGFMVQGGGLTPDMKEKRTRPSIPNEADNGLKNFRGTIAMARTSEPHSASSQFFINTKDNFFLDYRSPTQRGWGYCVFGRVIQGMETVDRIENVRTKIIGRMQDVPANSVMIQKAVVVEKNTP